MVASPDGGCLLIQDTHNFLPVPTRIGWEEVWMEGIVDVAEGSRRCLSGPTILHVPYFK